LLGFLVLALAGAILTRVTPLSQFLNTETMRGVARDLGWRGPLLLFGIAVVAPLLFLPRWPVAMTCGMLYGVAGGTLFANICGACGAWLQYGVARRTLSPMAEQWSDHPWMARLARHRDRAFPILFLLRAFPFSSSVATNMLAGTLQIRTRTFLAATFLGMFPSSLMYAAWGKLLKQPSAEFYFLAVAIVILFIAATWMAQRRLARWLPESPAPHPPAPGRNQTCQPQENRQGMEPPKNKILPRSKR
jgi:uncharacterized membrane protein YdjX (TVP38/TMEM64 family)